MDVPRGDPQKGRRIFIQRCSQCHTIEKNGPNKIGPNLFGIIGRETGQVEGYIYTKENKERGITWTKENLYEYLINPMKYIPGTKMIFAGLKKRNDRLDLIAFVEDSMDQGS